MCEMREWILTRGCLLWDSLSIAITLETFCFHFSLKFTQDFSSHSCCVKIIPQFSSRNYNHLILLSTLRVRNLGKAELSSIQMASEAAVSPEGLPGGNPDGSITHRQVLLNLPVLSSMVLFGESNFLSSFFYSMRDHGFFIPRDKYESHMAFSDLDLTSAPFC